MQNIRLLQFSVLRKKNKLTANDTKKYAIYSLSLPKLRISAIFRKKRTKTVKLWQNTGRITMQRDFVQQLLKSANALAAAYAAGNWAIHYAQLNRGYNAAGSEYFFILAVYIGAYATSGMFLRLFGSLFPLQKHAGYRLCQKNYHTGQSSPDNIILLENCRKGIPKQICHKISCNRNHPVQDA